jgi:hypothetical protein
MALELQIENKELNALINFFNTFFEQYLQIRFG